MAFDAGDVIDGRYVVQGLCSDAGGMGRLLFVQPIGAAGKLVLKYCKLAGDEERARFRREVRVMQGFAGNSHVVPILHANVDHDPPYFVMPYCSDGDMRARAHEIRTNHPALETVFNRMIDCVEQLHSRNVVHRDIKPENFLIHSGAIVVSDLGLCSEADSATGFTRSTQYAGTWGYMPPEFFTPGGFKSAAPSSDVFMLGKTFYFILTGRDPIYMVAQEVPPQLRPVIDRCCANDKASRYQDLAALRQSLTAAFDVLLGRFDGPARSQGTLRAIMDRLQTSNQYDPQMLGRFVEELAVLEQRERIQMCLAMPREVFGLVAQGTVPAHSGRFIEVYKEMAKEATYAFAFAETIATNMKTLFEGELPATEKAEALTAAIIAADRQNRFAAMDTCKQMIASVTDDELAQRVHDVMLAHPHYFIVGIEESTCKAPAVQKAVSTLKAREKAEKAAVAQGGSAMPF